MQENKKNGFEQEADAILAEAFGACMEEQLSFVPSEREIARMHVFSEAFQAAMAQLLKNRGKMEQRVLKKQEFVYRFNKIAACFLAFLVVGCLCTGAFLLFSPKGSSEVTESAPESAAADTESAPEYVAESEALEESEVEEAVQEESDSATKPAETVGFMGQEISLAAAQNLPDRTEFVKTLVNSPMVDREAESIKVTIGNMNEYPIYYYKAMDLEVWIDGFWYQVPGKQALTEEEQQCLVCLEAGMAQDEEIFLSNYDLDHDAERYRVVTYLDGLVLSLEFAFENLEEDLGEILHEKEK